MTPTEAAIAKVRRSLVGPEVAGDLDLALLLAAHDRYAKALRTIEAVTNHNGPDKASAQYMADTAHKIAQEALRCE